MRISYEDYIRSPEWRAKARVLRDRAGECALCTKRSNLEVHHRTYERLGSERDSDLIVLCGNCHRRHHGTFDDCMSVQYTLPMIPVGPELN